MLLLSKNLKTRFYSIGNEPPRSKKFFKIHFIKNKKESFQCKRAKRASESKPRILFGMAKDYKKLIISLHSDPLPLPQVVY
jgi:hypothetical protein